MNNRVTINSRSVVPLVGLNQTQIILQRHCNYDRNSGGLVAESEQIQSQISDSFLTSLVQNLTAEELNNTYFLFVASPTMSKGNFNRCIETTNIPFFQVRSVFNDLNISESHIMNLNADSHYDGIHKSKDLAEPMMFTDNSGYLEFLKQQNEGINLNFWIDFEEDKYKEKRQELGAEGPDEIVGRGIHFIGVLQRYSQLFHKKHENSRLIIWCGTHYDLLSPLAKQTILGYDKEDAVAVDYCGGISLLIDENNEIVANLNGEYVPICFPDSVQRRRHF